MPDSDVRRIQELLTTLIYDVAGARTAVRELRRLVAADVALRRTTDRRGDVLDDVVHDSSAEALDDTEIMLLYMSLVVGAFDTTANTMAVALAHLAAHPEAREALTADRSALSGAIDEYLRWDPTSQGMARTVHAETELAGQVLHPGDRLYVLTGSANRDPAQFPAPDACDLARRPNRHVGFGAGIHRCIGMHLAQLMLRCGISELLGRWPEMCLQPGAVLRYRTSQMRSLVAVPVVLSGIN
jgi:cytochrome P450